MAPPVFPDLSRRGLGFPVKKSTMQSTTIASHVSGREVRVRNWAQTLYRFELTFNVLSSSDAFAYTAVGANSLQLLMDFFNALGGSFGTFLYTDPTDNNAQGVPLTPIANGSITTFAFQRALFNWYEPPGYVSYVSQVYINGVPSTINWTLNNPTAAVPYPTLTFDSAPGANTVVSADFNWQFVCRSSDDTLDFVEDMGGLWSLKSWKFQSVRNGGF